MDIPGGLNIIEKIIKWGRFILERRKDNPEYYLEGPLKSGLDISYRFIGLFEAHDVKRTQIYRLLGNRFPKVGPALDVKGPEFLITGDLIDYVSNLFGVRKAWMEGESGPIYDPLIHYKNLSSFYDCVKGLSKNENNDHCLFTALKPSDTSTDLYTDCPKIALYFSEPIADLDGKAIYRHKPIFGPLPWDHSSSRFHLSAFFNIAYETPSIVVKGYDVNRKHVNSVSHGNAIPMYKAKITEIWHPEDYAYPLGFHNGRVKADDWQELVAYFNQSDESRLLKGPSGR